MVIVVLAVAAMLLLKASRAHHPALQGDLSELSAAMQHAEALLPPAVQACSLSCCSQLCISQEPALATPSTAATCSP